MTIPSWSIKARKAKPSFFRQWNDIDIFIEDTGISSKKLFRQIFSRCFGEKYRIAEVFPLGGKESVIDACTEDQNDGGLPRLYIVDGDLELILGKSIPTLKRLYSLPFYCIENILIDQRAIIEILYEEHSSAEHDQLESDFNFESWVSSIEPLLVDLFIDYAICKETMPTVETVKYKINHLVSSGDGLLDPSKIALRRKEIENHILTVLNSDEYNRRKIEIRTSLNTRGLLSAKRIASGKDYLLPLLRMRMRNVSKISAENDCLNVRLAKHCDLSFINNVCAICATEIARSTPCQ